MVDFLMGKDEALAYNPLLIFGQSITDRIPHIRNHPGRHHNHQPLDIHL
jgi:hypothetical protein